MKKNENGDLCEASCQQDALKFYFGEQISFYFEFVNYLQKWLIACIVVGLSVEIVNLSLNISVQTSQFELIFSVFI